MLQTVMDVITFVKLQHGQNFATCLRNYDYPSECCCMFAYNHHTVVECYCVLLCDHQTCLNVVACVWNE